MDDFFFFEIKKGLHLGAWSPRLNTAEKDSSKENERRARKRPKTRVETDKSKDTTHGRVYGKQKTSDFEEPVSPGMFPTLSDL